MRLVVSVVLNPQPSEISNEELDKHFAGEIQGFEQWFAEMQAKAGVPNQRLISPEHAIIRSFMFYLYGKSHDHDQAQ